MELDGEIRCYYEGRSLDPNCAACKSLGKFSFWNSKLAFWLARWSPFDLQNMKNYKVIDAIQCPNPSCDARYHKCCAKRECSKCKKELIRVPATNNDDYDDYDDEDEVWNNVLASKLTYFSKYDLGWILQYTARIQKQILKTAWFLQARISMILSVRRSPIIDRTSRLKSSMIKILGRNLYAEVVNTVVTLGWMVKLINRLGYENNTNSVWNCVNPLNWGVE